MTLHTSSRQYAALKPTRKQRNYSCRNSCRSSWTLSQTSRPNLPSAPLASRGASGPRRFSKDVSSSESSFGCRSKLRPTSYASSSSSSAVRSSSRSPPRKGADPSDSLAAHSSSTYKHKGAINEVAD
eukprot:CAMPEP_0196689774 /NCGR_PEP_ID=MMETSP1090-20130531/19008_1 /TAXON_ID=37098 /ORGANISM="Isochrysis sp, Strain CCMP1244" /LENGTH=126 /DNA_ID=CAMNT_0042028825 /DNA_START=30 /DNA_END=410 /DNA_ORIENTATION=+